MMRGMRSYKQHCGLAKTLDIVGDRWTLLIIRELLIRGSCRYTDLRNGLPGIATNLLAERLRELEVAGILTREDAPPPVATVLFQLTQRGKDLEPAILQLGLWGVPLLVDAPKRQVLQPHWLVLPLKLLLVDAKPDQPKVVIELRVGGEAITVTAAGGQIDVHLGAAERADAVVTGRPDVILQLLSGKLDLSAAKAAAVQWRGAAEVLQRVVPKVPTAQVGAAPVTRNETAL
jgi:DNA-binding HxlR family transcriptional regulator